MKPAIKIESWGRYPKIADEDQSPYFLHWKEDEIPFGSMAPHVLPHGMGRSYGDSCLNGGGTLLLTRGLNRFLSFDKVNGILRCEAGTTLAEILRLVTPYKWFLPVTPGTKFVTVGGAIANDVHGKNHHGDRKFSGTFGCFVRGLEILRSDGRRVVCGPSRESGLFQATVGGLGLTGLILWAEIQLKPIPSTFMETTCFKFRDLNEYFDLSREFDPQFEYTVSWVDALSREGRGIYMGGRHYGEIGKPSDSGGDSPAPSPSDAGGKLVYGRGLQEKSFGVIPRAPSWLLNPLTIKTFNTLYYQKQFKKSVTKVVSMDSYFYPLDAIPHWNHLYGPRGFVQYQFVVPTEAADSFIKIWRILHDFGKASFLTVLKTFGARTSPGMMSFPRPGITAAFDFPVSRDLFGVLDKVDVLVLEAGGALYPAKDARMSPASFKASFPRWEEFSKFMDPHFSSGFWRRVTR